MAAIFCGLAAAAAAQTPVRHDADASSIRAEGDGVAVDLALDRAVPWRLRRLQDPPRLAVEAEGVEWVPLPTEADGALGVAVRPAPDGGRRLVLTLNRPLRTDMAEMRTGPGGAQLALRLVPDAEMAEDPATLPSAAAPAVVVVDPGHGGRDPGAAADGAREAHVMLAFAEELAAALSDADHVRVVLTRRADRFVSLTERVRRTRAAGADLFVSLHADALPPGAGDATGATVYTLSDTASDAAARVLAERHGGIFLPEAGPVDEDVTLALLDIARRETAPRSTALAETMVRSFRAAGLPLHPRPQRSAAFAVLKAVDVPSVLVEVGYLDAPADRARLVTPAVRAPAVSAVAGAILTWIAADRLGAGR